MIEGVVGSRIRRTTVLLTLLTLPVGAQAQQSDSTIVVRAARIVDGRGAVLTAQEVVVRSGRIVALVPTGSGEGDRTIDLGDLTLLPGLIDTHVHLGWHFGADGKLAREDDPTARALHAVENAYAMLAAGVTTVQSLGGSEDGPVRDALSRGHLPGPRVLTSLGSLSARTGTPQQMRDSVRAFAERGADVIKIFGSESIRTGGAPSLSQAQLDAACGEAARLGLRTNVHAHGPVSAQRSVEAGCTTIEHGALLDRETLQLMADRGTFYDPNIHLIFQNYFDNEARYIGVGGYTAEGFEQMRQAVPRALEAFRTALQIPELKIVFGTDAVAGAHGRNVEELVNRVEEGGQDPMAALTSATSLAAESLGMGDRLGSLAPGMMADMIAVEGQPHTSIRDLHDVLWVMVRGRVAVERR